MMIDDCLHPLLLLVNSREDGASFDLAMHDSGDGLQGQWTLYIQRLGQRMYLVTLWLFGDRPCMSQFPFLA